MFRPPPAAFFIFFHFYIDSILELNYDKINDAVLSMKDRE